MVRIGLTGGIASGKTVVRRVFEQEGIPMLDADAVTHAYLAPGGALVGPVVERFGDEVLDAEGGVNRRALGARVFVDPEARRWLNRATHPRIRADIAAFLEARESEGCAAAGVEAALIVETGSYTAYDRVVVVQCAPAAQVERLLERNPEMTRQEARLRLSAQLSAEERARRATDVVNSDGALEETRARARELARRLLSEGGVSGAG